MVWAGNQKGDRAELLRSALTRVLHNKRCYANDVLAKTPTKVQWLLFGRSAELRPAEHTAPEPVPVPGCALLRPPGAPTSHKAPALLQLARSKKPRRGLVGRRSPCRAPPCRGPPPVPAGPGHHPRPRVGHQAAQGLECRPTGRGLPRCRPPWSKGA